MLRRSAEPRSPVLLGWCVQNGLQKRIEAPERDFPVPPVVGGVAEDVEQLLARFLVELGVGRDLLENDDKTRLRARFMQRVGHAVVQRVKILAEVRRKGELLGNQVENVLLGLGVAQVGVQEMLARCCLLYTSDAADE